MSGKVYLVRLSLGCLIGGTVFKASSVVLIITGRTMMVSVREAAIIDIPSLRVVTKKTAPNNP